MDEMGTRAAAMMIEPSLDWVITRDGDGVNGSGMWYAAATVGTLNGPATINLGEIGGCWIAEVMCNAGSLHEGDQRSFSVAITVTSSAPEAWAALLETCKAVGSVMDGLELMKAAEN
jgi:hypothetical protein